jgi:ATP-binding cassette subfamily B (MDR/TAP) protein 1
VHSIPQIAHRLSTVRGADQIVVFGENADAAVGGSAVVEVGSHEQLVRLGGAYKALLDAADKREQRPAPAARPSPASPPGRRSSTSLVALERRGSSLLLSGATGVLVEDAEEAAAPAGKAAALSPDDEPVSHVPASRVWAMMRPEYGLMAVGAAGAAIKGASQPCMSIIMSHLLVNLALVPLPLIDKPCKSAADCAGAAGCFDFSQFGFNASFCYSSFADGHGPEDVRSTGLEALRLYFELGLTVGAGLMVSAACFGLAGAMLTRRLRVAVFESLLRQDAAFFDAPANSVGVLLSRLSSDALLVQNATGDYLSLLVENAVAVAAAAVVAFTASWRMASVVFLPCGLLIWSSFNDQKRMQQFAKQGVLDKASEQIINQALSSVRTVYSCTAERRVSSMYEAALRGPMVAGINGARVMGLQTGTSQALYQIIYAGAFWWGAELVRQGKIDSQALSKVFFVSVLPSSSD